MIKGTLKADAILLMEISHASFLAGVDNPRMRAKFAFASSTSGATMGSVEHENWSIETLAKLKALRESMERDVAKSYMAQAESSSATSSPADNPPKGLAEHLGRGEDAPPL